MERIPVHTDHNINKRSKTSRPYPLQLDCQSILINAAQYTHSKLYHHHWMFNITSGNWRDSLWTKDMLNQQCLEMPSGHLDSDALPGIDKTQSEMFSVDERRRSD